MDSTKTTTIPALVTFGEDFETHGGLRALAIADGMHDDDPVDDLGYLVDTASTRLGDELALEGYDNWDDLEPLAGACYELRMDYGHGVWIDAALLDYLKGVKGLGAPEAAATRDRMVADAKARFAPIHADYERRRDLDQIEHLERMVKMYEDLAAQDLKWLTELKARRALAEAA